MNRIPDTRIHHGFNLPLLAAAALAVFGVASSHGAVLGVPGATQVEYTFGENGADWAVNFQTDASGNWRTMTGGGGSGLWTGGLLCIGSAKSLMIQGFCDAYGMNNTAGMATDFQASIFLYASGRWPAVGDNGTGTAIFHIDDLSLQADGHPDGSMTYYASVAGTRLGSFTASENQSTGLMVQKLNNVFSYWVSTDYGTTWSQYGPDFSAPSAKNDFRNTHLFVRPGGGSNYWGNADEFKVVAVTAPGYATLYSGSVLLALITAANPTGKLTHAAYRAQLRAALGLNLLPSVNNVNGRLVNHRLNFIRQTATEYEFDPDAGYEKTAHN